MTFEARSEPEAGHIQVEGLTRLKPNLDRAEEFNVSCIIKSPYPSFRKTVVEEAMPDQDVQHLKDCQRHRSDGNT